jgi:ABC-type dipeptide/oligopeptide/nickel transport system permease subunit
MTASTTPVGPAATAAPDGPYDSLNRRILQVLVTDRIAGIGAVVFAAMIMVALIAPLVIDFHPRAIALDVTLEPPGQSTVLGRDQLGRDVLERLLIGTRHSLLNGIGALVIALLVGVPLGLASGYFRSLIDEVVMWAVEVLMALPGILLALLVVAVLGPGQRNVVIAVGISAIPVFTRLTRGAALAIRELDYVAASRIVGARSLRVLSRHVLPGVVPAIVVTAVLSLGTMIISIAGLGFLGFGGEASIPEWGAMLREGLQYMRVAPWLVLAPAVAILVTVLSLNLLGDGLADALDPRSSTRARPSP